jgi:hypothetical protein
MVSAARRASSSGARTPSNRLLITLPASWHSGSRSSSRPDHRGKWGSDVRSDRDSGRAGGARRQSVRCKSRRKLACGTSPPFLLHAKRALKPMAPDWRSASKPSFQMTKRAASISVFADRCEFPSRLPCGAHFMRRRTHRICRRRGSSPLGSSRPWKSTEAALGRSSGPARRRGLRHSQGNREPWPASVCG